MLIQANTLNRDRCHDLLKHAVAPRPVAWITTLRQDGVVNVAPYSCFTFVGLQPMTLCISFERNAAGQKKATLANIERTRELVVHPATEDFIEQVNGTAMPAPGGEDKLARAGLTAASSEIIGAPRIAECPIAMECRLLSVQPVGEQNEMVLAQVVAVHIDDDIVADGEIDPARYHPIGRMGGDSYVRVRDFVELPRS